MDSEIVDHSLNLSGGVDERDAGFGVERLADGTIVQRDTPQADTHDEGHERQH
jgi:hypothetical protein